MKFSQKSKHKQSRVKLKMVRQSELFGFVSREDQAKIVILPVPWEVTTSYGGGTSRGPKAVFDASPQIDLFDLECGEPYKVGIFYEHEDQDIKALNSKFKPLALKIKRANELAAMSDPDGLPNVDLSRTDLSNLNKINAACETMVSYVYEHTKKVLGQNKIPGLLGGDHSTPLGAIKAVCDHYQGQVGILHIDAHADLRYQYQGFTHSHASIMRNVCALTPGPQNIVQVGIRDFCKEEFDFIRSNSALITTHFDRSLKSRLFSGESWVSICNAIIADLPKKVYVSFDIDGLSPDYCPNTGTPVPGGLSFDHALEILKVLGKSGKQIVGFDLNEVAPGKTSELDANVGARLLYKLCGWSARTNGLT